MINTSQIRTAHNYYGDITISALEEMENKIKKLERNIEKLFLLLLIKLNL